MTVTTRRTVLGALASSPLWFHAGAWAQNSTLKISHQFPGGTVAEGDFRDRLCRMFATEVEKRTKGALKFDFERMNELQYYDATLPRAVQGWSTIMCTHGGDHPYVANWWPDAHIIGYEHGFTNEAYDILRVLGGEAPTVPSPDFEDAYQTQRVLEAAMLSASERRPVNMDDVR